jgi:hypothetical protein
MEGFILKLTFDSRLEGMRKPALVDKWRVN